ncbi:g5174 [Coccomyxa elongata]
MGGCASRPSTAPDPPHKSNAACCTPRKEHAAQTALQAEGEQAQPTISTILEPKPPRLSQVSEDNQGRESADQLSALQHASVYHDSAGSVPGPAEPGSRAAQRHLSAWGTPLPPAQQPMAPLGSDNARRVSLSVMPEESRLSMSFGGDVPISPFEASMANHRERQQRYSVDLANVPRPASESLDDVSAFRRERLANRRHSISVAAPSQLRGSAHVVSELERTNKAGLDRILRLSASVFRTDSVLLHLRDGDKVFAREEDAAFSEGVRAAACRALEPPDSGIAVVDDPASDPRLAGEEEARAALKFFAGAPLMASNGYRLGSLVLCHSKAYTLDFMNRSILKNMADLMVREVWGAYEHAHSQRILQLTKVADCYSEPHLFVEVSDLQPWRIIRINQAAVRVTGLERKDATGLSFWDVFEGIENSSNTKRAQVAAKASIGSGFNLINMVATKRTPTDASEPVTFTCTFRPAARDMAIEGDTRPRAISNAGRHYYFVGIRVEATTPITSCVERTPFKGLVLGAQLGKGAFGRVYKGYYNGKVIAVKVCNSCNLRCDAAGVPFEASLTLKLEHPNLVRTLETAKASKDATGPQRSPSLAGGPQNVRSTLLEGTPLERLNSARLMEETWLLLDYCDMGSLMDAISKAWFMSAPKGPTNLPIVLATAKEMASGLAFLHSQGLVHGDLSSGNVLLASAPDAPHGFTAKISDFGLSRRMDIQSRIETKTTGTVNYMPPEVLSEGIISKAADVYAFGVLLWEMVCGQRAWDGLTPPQVMLAVACQQKQLTYPNWAPAEIAKLGEECLSAEPGARPTMEEVQRRLEKLHEKLLAHADSMDLSHFRALSCPS